MEGLRFWCARAGGEFVRKKTQRWFMVAQVLSMVLVAVSASCGLDIGRLARAGGAAMVVAGG